MQQIVQDKQTMALHNYTKLLTVIDDPSRTFISSVQERMLIQILKFFERFRKVSRMAMLYGHGQTDMDMTRILTPGKFTCLSVDAT